MQLLFSLIVITSTWCLGIKIITSDGMVLEKLGKWGQKKVDEGYKIFEALFVCQWCMPSIHTMIGMAFAYKLGIMELSWDLLFYYPIVAMGSSLVNGLVWLSYNTLSAKKELSESASETSKLISEWLVDRLDNQKENED